MASIFGRDELASDEALYVLDVNQWMGALYTDLGIDVTVKINTKTGPRVLEYALNGHDMPMLGGGTRKGRRTGEGKRVIIGSSASIFETFVHTLSTQLDPKRRVDEATAKRWFLQQLKNLKDRGALVFDKDIYDHKQMVTDAASEWGMHDWEDQIVCHTCECIGAEAVIGLDDRFQFAFERKGRRWITPAQVLCLMPS